MPDDLEIRKACMNDITAMADLINGWAERGVMLHRSLAELYEDVRDFHVACIDQRVVGVAGLRIMWANLAELYALAVDGEARSRGIGRKLVDAIAEEADALGIGRIFALTYEQQFFERCDFTLVDRKNLPQKVWSECVRCSKREACDEIAMIRVLNPNAKSPETVVEEMRADAQRNHYEAPIQIRNLIARSP